MKNNLYLLVIICMVGCLLTTNGFTSTLEDDGENVRVVFTSLTEQPHVSELKKQKNVYSIDLTKASGLVTAIPIFKEQFPSVKELYVSRTSFVEQIIESLPVSMPNLEILTLCNSGAMSSSFKNLSDLKFLRVVDISGTYVTDKKHMDSLLSENSSLVVYVQSLKDFPFSSIDLKIYEKDPRIVRSEYVHLPLSKGSFVTISY